LKIVSSDRSEKKGDGSGQFITFNQKACYDSDRDGYTVSNGTLKFGKQDGDRVYYSGSSYWGGATYVFTESYNRLNIRVEQSGKTYVYVRATPPSDARTCALIRKNESSSPSNPVVIIPTYPGTPVTTVTTGTPQRQPRTCSTCNGKGFSFIKIYPPQYGTDGTYSTCSQCGEWGKTHTHDFCRTCIGRGYIE
jgi:hypothetical protein